MFADVIFLFRNTIGLLASVNIDSAYCLSEHWRPTHT